MAREMKDSGIEWIGEIPEEWKVLPAQRGFREIKTKNTNGDVQNALQFKFGEIIPKKNFDADSDEYVADTIMNYTIVEPGTVMINGLNLNYDFKTLRTGLVKEKGVITSAYLALWPNQELITSEYATYLFKGYETRMALHNMGSGIRLTLGFKELKKQPILYPSIDEQKQIVAYLDEECAHIDSVIEQTHASIEEYKKLKQAVITHAVTKGIRPDRQMKDSGVRWIGKIPDKWSVSSLNRGIELIQTGPFGSQLHADEYVSNEIVVVNPANISNGEIIPDNSCTITKSKAYELSRHILKRGDIVIGRRGEMGRCACVIDDKRDYICGTGCIQIRLNDKIVPAYLSYYLQNPCIKQYLEIHSVGTTMQNLNTSIVGNIPILLLDINEQEEIVSYLDRKKSEIDQLIFKKEKAVEELNSYKKSLIYEYVTGKKEVPA